MHVLGNLAREQRRGKRAAEITTQHLSVPERIANPLQTLALADKLFPSRDRDQRDRRPFKSEKYR
jgi:hypothetical protein